MKTNLILLFMISLGIKTSIKARSIYEINLDQFSKDNALEKLNPIELICPYSEQRILRMPIKIKGGSVLIPKNLEWLKPMIYECLSHQLKLNLFHPYCYVTVRHGITEDSDDDKWHTDGFSMKIPHIPQQSYIWSDIHPTEYVEQPIEIPNDFDPLVYNLHEYIGEVLKDHSEILTMDQATIYCMDPYIIHRRPKASTGDLRTFVRISFIPIEIKDSSNFTNPLIGKIEHPINGKEVRLNLKNYHTEKLVERL